MKLAIAILAAVAAAPGQTAKEVREVAKGGVGAIPRLQAYLKSPDLEVRVEAVKAIVNIGTPRSLDPLVEAARDNDAEIQIRATDGLVNYYLPGYVKTGMTASLRRAGAAIRTKFTDTNDQVIDAYVPVRQDVAEAIGRLARGASSLEGRANAARAAGILRAKPALPDLYEALKTKDSLVLYEALIAFQKIGDPAAAPKARYLLRDFNERVQIAAIETTGIFLNREALPDLIAVLNAERSNKRVKRAALTAIAMMPDEKNRPLLTKYLSDPEEGLRGAAAEGLGRLKNPADLPLLEKASEEEGKPSARVSMAFALVALGRNQVSEFSPLQILVNTLNSKSRQGEAFPLLAELARDPAIRSVLYTMLPNATKEEKIYLARVMARSGSADSVPELEKLTKDPDPAVALEAVRSLQNLKSRL